MIHYIEGDIFNSPAQVIVNTVNTVGVMGKGPALAFKQKYPKMFISYRNACEKKQLTVGKLMLFHAPDYWILLFPTKETGEIRLNLNILKRAYEICEYLC